ncbi:MAG TPA: polysaccharide biosynthesis C-terminal domain-containing protein [Terriglobales bacterium]|nr:polysaccharide biosynthesis C-terminal domain-containing protein [Terriglobales bacterium]
MGRNFIFMGLEVVITLVCTLLTTVVIAQVIGPTRLGYFNLVFWLTSITCSVGSLGIPLTTFKYMGEFLGGGRKELARAVFFYNFWAQLVIAFVLASLGVIVVFAIVDPAYRSCSLLLVLSMVPNMLTFVPSQANSAAEDAALNTRGALAGTVVYVIAVAVSLLSGWNLVGIAASVLLYRSTELVVKIIPVLKSMKTVPPIPLPPEVRQRMFSFSGLSTWLMILQIVIWDRSDIIFLKLLQSDIRQLAFFSVCFSVADRVMRVPQTFANALAATQMAEYGRDKDRLFKSTSQASTYVLLGALPMLIGLACIAGPFVRVLYGPQYLPAIPVFVVVALLSIPKAVLTPALTLLYSAEDLRFILKWSCIAAASNVSLDLALIPGQGAIGAAWANGIAQTFAAFAIWGRVLVRYPVRLDMPALRRLVGATLAMAIVVLGIVALPLSVILQLSIAVPAGVIVFVVTSRMFMVLQKDDRQRLLVLSSLLPTPVGTPFARLVDFLVPKATVAEVSR